MPEGARAGAGPRVAVAVLGKDLRLDLRSRDRLGHMAVFALLVVALLSIALPDARSTPSPWIPPLVWTVFLFTALLGLGQSFQGEVEDGAGQALVLVPCDRGWVFLGKAAANAIALGAVALWTALLCTVFLDVDWSARPAAAALAGGLGVLGLSATGTLLSAMAVAARFREFLLPVILFPLVLPVLVAGSELTARALAGEAVPSYLWWGLGLYDWTFLLVGFFAFDPVLEE